MRLTRKPRLFASAARHTAGAGAMLLALAPQLASAQDGAAQTTTPLRHLHEDSVASTSGVEQTASPIDSPALASPIGWIAAGALLALALCSPKSASSPENT